MSRASFLQNLKIGTGPSWEETIAASCVGLCRTPSNAVTAHNPVQNDRSRHIFPPIIPPSTGTTRTASAEYETFIEELRILTARPLLSPPASDVIPHSLSPEISAVQDSDMTSDPIETAAEPVAIRNETLIAAAAIDTTPESVYSASDSFAPGNDALAIQTATPKASARHIIFTHARLNDIIIAPTVILIQVPRIWMPDPVQVASLNSQQVRRSCGELTRPPGIRYESRPTPC